MKLCTCPHALWTHTHRKHLLEDVIERTWPWLTLRLDLGNQRLLTPTPILGRFFPTPLPKLQLLQGLNPIKVSVSTFKILVGRCGDLLTLQNAKTSLVCKFPCLFNLPHTNLEWPASSFSLSLPSMYMDTSLQINYSIHSHCLLHLFRTHPTRPVHPKAVAIRENGWFSEK